MTDLPWVSEAKKHIGLQEVRDNAKLRAYFKTADIPIDPQKTPWCGYFQQAVFHTVLPKQPMIAGAGWAKNWLGFGVKCNPQYGSILVFSRNGGGHVAICLGESNGGFVCLGGNQGNSVCIEVHTKDGFLGARWPDTFGPAPNAPMPELTAAGYKALTNEA